MGDDFKEKIKSPDPKIQLLLRKCQEGFGALPPPGTYEKLQMDLKLPFEFEKQVFKRKLYAVSAVVFLRTQYGTKSAIEFSVCPPPTHCPLFPPFSLHFPLFPLHFPLFPPVSSRFPSILVTKVAWVLDLETLLCYLATVPLEFIWDRFALGGGGQQVGMCHLACCLN